VTRRTRGLAIGAVALTALGGGAALAAGAGGVFGGGEREALLNGVASKLGVTPEKLRDAISQALDERLDAAVKAGKLTEARADALRARLKAGGGGLLGPGFGRIGPGGFGGPGLHGGMVLLRPQTAEAAASYLGLTPAQLHEQLRSGKSLGEIAKAQGKTADGLKAAMTAAVKKDLDAAVKAGKLTQAQADERLKELGERIDDAIAGTVRVAPAPGARGLPGLGKHLLPGLGRGPFGIRSQPLEAAAAYLGLNAAQLREQLGSGKTLAEIAKAKGKTADGLRAAMTAAVKKDLDAAVKAGKLTQAQADDVLKAHTQRLDDLIAGRPFFERRWERGPRA
jgi:urease accessory protein UreF